MRARSRAAITILALVGVLLLVGARMIPSGAVTPSAAPGARVPTPCGSLQDRIDGTPTGGTLDLAGCSYVAALPALISRPITIRGGAVSAPAGGLLITSSHVSISGMLLRGSGATSDERRYGIEIRGPTASSYLTDITLSDNTLTAWDGEAIHATLVEDFTFSDNDISDVFYAGIGCYSVRSGHIVGNHVRDVTGTGNAYGIYLSRRTGGLGIAPRSSDVVVEGNTVEDIPHWEGLDTHGGERIQFIGNTIRRVRNPIMVGASVDVSGGPDAYAPLDVVVVDNTIASDVSDGSMDAAIYFQGASGGSETGGGSTELATGGVIDSNRITGYGDQSNGDSAAILTRDTSGLRITNNVIVEASPSAISPYVNNYDLTITGNLIRAPWSEALPYAYGVYVHVDYNTGTISGNTFDPGTKEAASVLTKNVEVGAGPHNRVVIH